MPAKKLYRQTMAELAGITPVQLDYLVRIGAVAPDLGKARKYYSLKEATFVLLSGQLISLFSEQRLIVDVIQYLRSYLDVPGCEGGRIYEYSLASHDAELWDTDPKYLEPQIHERAAHRFVKLMRYKLKHPKNSLTFMRVYCAVSGLDFDEQMEIAQRQVRNIAYNSQYHGPLTLHDFIMRDQYMRSVFGAPTYIHIAKNGDGSVETMVDSDTVGFEERISWTIINCGKLFTRLANHAESEYLGVAEDFISANKDACPDSASPSESGSSSEGAV